MTGLDDIFGRKPAIDLSKAVNHSGGAEGSDTYWENIGEEYGVKTRAYSYKTPKHDSKNKVEISDTDYNEGIAEITRANKTLGRYGIHKYMNLLARNWAQIKYSKQVFAIGSIIDPGHKNDKGYYNKSSKQIVDGGTGYAVQMGIDNNREVFVFDQPSNKWYMWNYVTEHFVETETPTITFNNFAGIGTRSINPNGIQAIKDVYEKTNNW